MQATGQIFHDCDACAGGSGSHVLRCFLRVASGFFCDVIGGATLFFFPNIGAGWQQNCACAHLVPLADLRNVFFLILTCKMLLSFRCVFVLKVLLSDSKFRSRVNGQQEASTFYGSYGAFGLYACVLHGAECSALWSWTGIFSREGCFYPSLAFQILCDSKFLKRGVGRQMPQCNQALGGAALIR